MTKFFTRQGDGGSSILRAKKIAKHHPVLVLLGVLDELNSWLGVCKVQSEKNKTKSISQTIRRIQQELFIAQAEMAAALTDYPAKVRLTAERVKWLEGEINKIDKLLPTITKFIINGGSRLAAELDYARTLARRAERAATVISGRVRPSSVFLAYLNRLSSLLFALARFVNFKLKIKEENPNYK